jgi:hypothetical protein
MGGFVGKFVLSHAPIRKLEASLNVVMQEGRYAP